MRRALVGQDGPHGPIELPAPRLFDREVERRFGHLVLAYEPIAGGEAKGVVSGGHLVDEKTNREAGRIDADVRAGQRRELGAVDANELMWELFSRTTLP